MVSRQTGHSATGLCRSRTSWGPDSVSIEEGVFCDMETSEVLPIRKDDDAEKCFDVEKRQTKRKDTEGVFMYMPAKNLC